jgi:hypothetical protein
MAIKILHVDDLHKTVEGKDVEADETLDFAVEGAEYSIDLTTTHAEEFRAVMAPYIKAATPSEAQKKRTLYRAPAGDTPMKRARDHGKRIRAFANSRPDLGERSYLTEGGNYSHTKRLKDAYAAYVAEYGEFPLPEDNA